VEHRHALTINVVGHHHALTINEFQSVNLHLATALEGCFLGKRGKQSQSDVMQKRRVPEVCLLEWLHGNSKWTSVHFL